MKNSIPLGFIRIFILLICLTSCGSKKQQKVALPADFEGTEGVGSLIWGTYHTGGYDLLVQRGGPLVGCASFIGREHEAGRGLLRFRIDRLSGGIRKTAGSFLGGYAEV